MKIAQWLVCIVCAIPAVTSLRAVVEPWAALPAGVIALLVGIAVLHFGTAYGLMRWRPWSRWLAAIAAATYFLVAFANFKVEEPTWMTILCVAGGVVIMAWILSPAVSRRFPQAKDAT